MDMQTPYVKQSIIAVAVLLSLFLLVVSIKEMKSIPYVGRDVPTQNVISVNGTGEAVAKPENVIAKFTFGITEEAPNVATAQKNATNKINAAIDFVKKNGVADKDITTTSYNINPVYDYANGVCNSIRCTPSKQTLRGYEVSQMVEVKVRKTEDAGKLLTGIAEQGITNVSGLNFTIDQEDALKADARAKAIEEAKTKAETLAKQLGVRLVRIVNFSESGDVPIYYSKVGYGMGGGVDAQAAPAPTIPTGEQKITSNVTISYEIR